MTEGDVVIASIQQADGLRKNRPGIFLREIMPYGDLLICGVSTQLRLEIKGFDEIISSADPDFVSSGLSTASLVRLGYLVTVPRNSVPGKIGSIASERHRLLLERLSEYLVN